MRLFQPFQCVFCDRIAIRWRHGGVVVTTVASQVGPEFDSLSEESLSVCHVIKNMQCGSIQLVSLT